MNLNKIIVVMLMLFMILSNALPAGAVRGKKRSVAQRKSESDSYSMDSSDDSDDDDDVDSDDGDDVDSDDDDDVDSEMEDECVDMDVFDSEEDASNLGDAPAKKRRLSSIGFDESKILVMKLGSSEVKTFNDFSGAINWLQAHGWSSDRLWNIKRAIRKLSLAYGWGWEVRAKSEELINLLNKEPLPKQIAQAQSRTKVRRLVSNKLVVMSLEKNPVKTFNSFIEARRWLQAHGWSSARMWNIKQAIRKLSLAYGWGWEVRDKSEELINLLKNEPLPEQIDEAKSRTKGRGLVLNSRDKLLVMSLGKNPVKTFNNFIEARRWLQAHGWPSAISSNIKRAIRKLSLAYGWGWEVRDKSEELIKLLDAELSPEQIKEAKNHTRNAKQLQMMKGPELETKSEDVSVEDDSLIASELPVGTLPCTHDTVVGMPIEGIENRSETAAIFGSDQLNDMSSSDAENAAGICRFEDLVQYAFY